MDKILHDPKDPKLWELWYIPYNGSCRILSINSIVEAFVFKGGALFPWKRQSQGLKSTGYQHSCHGLGFRV